MNPRNSDTCLIEGLLLLAFVVGTILGMWAQLHYVTQ